MRKVIVFLPFLFAPALAGAAHGIQDARAAYELQVEAGQLYRQVAYLRGNKQLKRQARRFVRDSERLLKQTRQRRPARKAARTLDELNEQFYDLRYGVANARVRPRVRQRLRRQMRVLSAALSYAEEALLPVRRDARSWSASGYGSDRYSGRLGGKQRRQSYRNQR